MTTRTAAETRQDLLAAASDLLSRGGPEHVTLRAVGAAAGVSRTAPYRHFVDKDDLLSALAAENLLVLGERMRAAADDEAAGGSRLFRVCMAYVAVALERPAHYRLIFGDHQIARANEAQQAAADAGFAYLVGLVARAQQDGGLAAGDPREVASLLWATLHGLIDLTLTGHLREPRTVDGATSMARLVELGLRNLAPR